jgi:hypothetical protein
MKKIMIFRIAFVILFTAISFGGFAQNAEQNKINIIDFHIVKNQNRVDINWSTKKDETTNYFEVEKSNDGKNFKTVALIMGPDPSKTNCDCYGCFDKVNTKSKESYYRLKHVDNNGMVQFSDVKMIALR